MDEIKLDNCIRYYEKLKDYKDEAHLHFSPEMTDIFYLLDTDFDYFEHKHQLDQKNKQVEEMDLDELSTMLTFIERGDRFCEGMLEDYIEDGTILRILYRIRNLTTKKN